jgi:hypothetical protein
MIDSFSGGRCYVLERDDFETSSRSNFCLSLISWQTLRVVPAEAGDDFPG